MTDLQSIEVREGWKKYYLFGLLAWVAFISIGFIIPGQRQGTIDFFFTKWTLAKLPALLFLFVWVVVCLYYYFDKTMKVRIDSKGIWTTKYKNVSWTAIWYFSSTICKMGNDGDIYYLKIKLKDTDENVGKEINIKFKRMDKDFIDIRDVFSFYAMKYKIEDLGHENEI